MLRALARDVLDGHKTVSELERSTDNRQSARTVFATVAQEYCRQMVSCHTCAACGSSEPKHDRVYEWMAVINRRLKKTILLVVLLFPYIVICQFLPAYYVPNINPQTDILHFTTTHRLCAQCNRRIRVFAFLRPFLQFLLGIPLFLSFAGLIISMVLSLACFTGLWGCKLLWLKYSLPSLIGSLILVSLLRFATTRMLDILITPPTIRSIERGGFRVSMR